MQTLHVLNSMKAMLRDMENLDLFVSAGTTRDAIAKIEQLQAERDAWKKLVNDAERAIGMDSVAVSPEAKSLVEWCDEKRDEIERLHVMLPKTADGVPIAKGTIIYQAAGAYNMLEHEVSGWQFADDGSLKILMFGRGWTAFCDGWYSTRELAEAARAEGPE